jgi:hypothetical protein
MSGKQISDKLAELHERLAAAQAAILALDVYAAQLRDALKRAHRAVIDANAAATEMSFLTGNPPPKA